MGEEKGPGEEGKGVFMGCWVDFQYSLQRSFDILPWALRLFCVGRGSIFLVCHLVKNERYQEREKQEPYKFLKFIF